MKHNRIYIVLPCLTVLFMYIVHCNLFDFELGIDIHFDVNVDVSVHLNLDADNDIDVDVEINVAGLSVQLLLKV